MAVKHKPYNGWYNRATWNVALWIQNDEGMYIDAGTFARGEKKLKLENVRDFCVEIFGGVKTPDGDSLFDVHWPEIVSMFKELRDE